MCQGRASSILVGTVSLKRGSFLPSRVSMVHV
ncbi:unnamed protein product [Ectocarpus sp. CCAP 1310/34]|nr:unnamed protein product [Ectocarpus sp. CCAP 1310/34]